MLKEMIKPPNFEDSQRLETGTHGIETLTMSISGSAKAQSVVYGEILIFSHAMD